MAHKKAGGSTNLGRDSAAKRLGIKKYGEETVRAGNIIIRQRGSKYRAGTGTRMGKDQTIFAVRNGLVKFLEKKVKTFRGNLVARQFVSVIDKIPKKLE